MWIVKNGLRATLTLRGLGVSIAPGQEFDLDVIGRDTAEKAPQIAVALEEGYLRNIFKAAREAVATPATPAPQPDLSGLVTSADFERFKTQFLDELRSQLPVLQKLERLDQLETGAKLDLKAELESFRKNVADVRSFASAASDMKEAAGELKKLAHDKIDSEKRRILSDRSLSEAETKARLAFLDEKERELVKNFDTVGKKVEAEDGDVLDKADLLSGEL